MPIYWSKRVFYGFETNFTAFAVIFLALLIFFASIGGTVAKIREKMCVRQL